ncbi:MAG TPA: alginate lyase family protein, partial [Myxococcota bacterium]
MRLRDAGRALRTIAHLRPSQIFHRARLTARRALWVRMGPRIDAAYRARAASGRVRWDHPGLRAVATLRAARRDQQEAHRAACEALEGRFTLLGETRDLGLPVAWDRPDLMQALLWKTHLHELGWSFDLARAAHDTGKSRFREGFVALVRAYLDAQPIARPGFQRVAWNERVVATRLMHLAAAGALLDLREGTAEGDWLGREIVRHALFLRDNLALDLLANHLFRDCVALAFADAIAGCAPDGLDLLEREVQEQILPDGAHYERSAMYHAVCLADLVDLQALLGAEAPAWLSEAVRRAGGFLESVLLGDDDIPLLGDAWLGEVAPRPLLEQARAVAGPLVAPHAPERASGLVRLTSGPTRAVIRAGPHGPDHQLGHAHADLLSFELSHGARRIVTDTGTGAYAAGPVRQHLRSTAAHNTLQLDGAELLEAWSSFRSGRRGRATCHARGENARFVWLHASHDAWRRLPGAPVHHRLLVVGEQSVLVLDAVLGRGRHRITSRLHLHPEATEAVRVQALAGVPEIGKAPLHERFGETREMPVLRVDLEAELPWIGGYWLRLDAGPEARATLACNGAAARAEIAEPGGRLQVDWRF